MIGMIWYVIVRFYDFAWILSAFFRRNHGTLCSLWYYFLCVICTNSSITLSIVFARWIKMFKSNKTYKIKTRPKNLGKRLRFAATHSSASISAFECATGRFGRCSSSCSGTLPQRWRLKRYGQVGEQWARSRFRTHATGVRAFPTVLQTSHDAAIWVLCW